MHLLKKIFFKEIKHSRFNFILSVAVVSIISFIPLASITIFEVHHTQKEQYYQQELEACSITCNNLHDIADSAMSQLGFDLIIIPKQQNIIKWYADNSINHYFSIKEYHTLKNSNLACITNLTAQLRKKVLWKEQNWKIIFVARDNKQNIGRGKFIRYPGKKGEVNLGYYIWHDLKLSSGDNITINGKSFIINHCYPETGNDNKEDIYIWFEWSDMEIIANNKNSITEILAKESRDFLGKVEDIQKALNNIAIDAIAIEKSSKIATQKMVQLKTAETTYAMIVSEQDKFQSLACRDRKLATLSLSALSAIGAMLLGLLLKLNFSKRSNELGIWLALGCSNAQLFTLLVMRSLLILFSSLSIAIIFTMLAVFKYISSNEIDIIFADLNLSGIIWLSIITILAMPIAIIIPLSKIRRIDPITTLNKGRY